VAKMLNKKKRHGALAVETAIVLPVMLFCILGIILGGMAVFCHQLVAYQAREAARFASVRGGDYQRDTDAESPTVQQIMDQAVMPVAVGMDPALLSIQVQWIDRGINATYDWDGAAKDVRSITDSGEYISNTVRVTVTYQWSPGVFMDPITVRGTCEVPMMN
jgi:Flp pilus assembly protein TadG